MCPGKTNALRLSLTPTDISVKILAGKKSGRTGFDEVERWWQGLKERMYH